MKCPNCGLQVTTIPCSGDTIVYKPILSSDFSFFSSDFDCQCGTTGTFYWDLNEDATQWETIDDKCEGGIEE